MKRKRGRIPGISLIMQISVMTCCRTRNRESMIPLGFSKEEPLVYVSVEVLVPH